MIKAAIIGGAGYTAGELIRILIQHPQAEIVSVLSLSHSGEPVHKAHPDLVGETDLVFSDAVSPDADVVFLCSGHGKSKALLEEVNLPSGAKVIDLSSDFRIQDRSHDFVYGLPELNRETIKGAKNIANPGCFATCIQLSLLPLAREGFIQDGVHVSAITGSTGAGQSPTDTTHFSWRSNNVSIYKAFTHQHLGEIHQSLKQLQPQLNQNIYFIPMRGAFTRGILSACYLTMHKPLKETEALYREYYEDHPFVHVVTESPDVKQVVNTNKALLFLQKQDDQLLVTGVIDNLVKGASGQAVQNMNLMFGLEETTGLHLKATAF